MLDGVLSLIPGAKVSAVGVARNEETLEAHTYLEKLAPDINQRLALIIDRCWPPAARWLPPSTC